jgi:hypothetical protein
MLIVYLRNTLLFCLDQHLCPTPPGIWILHLPLLPLLLLKPSAERSHFRCSLYNFTVMLYPFFHRGVVEENKLVGLLIDHLAHFFLHMCCWYNVLNHFGIIVFLSKRSPIQIQIGVVLCCILNCFLGDVHFKNARLWLCLLSYPALQNPQVPFHKIHPLWPYWTSH